jgi:hypothetical protein
MRIPPASPGLQLPFNHVPAYGTTIADGHLVPTEAQPRRSPRRGDRERVFNDCGSPPHPPT